MPSASGLIKRYIITFIITKIALSVNGHNKQVRGKGKEERKNPSFTRGVFLLSRR